MEHRYTRRIPVYLRATVSGPNTAPVPAVVRNVSSDGLFITSPAMEHIQDRLVEVRIHGDAPAPRDRLSALVVHRKAQGAGLLLVEDNPLYAL